MRTTLKNIVVVTDLAVGASQVVPHGLNINGNPVVPQVVIPSNAGFTITASSTSLTVTRTAAAFVNIVAIYVERWHSIEDVEPPGGLGNLIPFIPSASGGSGNMPATIVLPGGSSNLSVPNLVAGSGPLAYPISGVSGTVITGITAFDLVEYAILAVLITLINVGADTITTSPDDSTSPQGFRFSQAIEITSGAAAMFIYAAYNGDGFWCPVFPTSG